MCVIHPVSEEPGKEDSPCTADIGKGFVEAAGLQPGLGTGRIQASREKGRGKGAKGKTQPRLRALGTGILGASGDIFMAELRGGTKGLEAGAEMRGPQAVLTEGAGCGVTPRRDRRP